MDILNENIKKILNEKGQKCKPENIKKGISILGVEGILKEGTEPTGTIDITENGEFDVTEYANANVNVQAGGDPFDYFKEEPSSTSGSTSLTGCVKLIKKFPTGIKLPSNCSYMFRYTSGAFGSDVITNAHFDTTNVTDMSYMFQGCSIWTELDLSEWTFENVTNIAYMFSNCTALTTLNLKNMKTTKLKNISSMLQNRTSGLKIIINQSAYDWLKTRISLDNYTIEIVKADWE